MEKISMQKIIQMLQDDKSHIPVDKLTMMQKYGMIEYAFINQPELIPQVMRLLTMHAASRNEQKRYIDYFFLTLKQQRDVFPFEMLEYHNISHCFDDAQITKFFQIVKDRIGNRIFTYDQLLTILEKTILPKYVKGIHPKKDVTIDTSVEFAAMSGSFIGGNGDFVNLFEPNALQLEKQGYGHVVASLGELGGVVPYTAYHARKSYIANNKDIIQGFSNAIQKGIDYVKNHSDEEVAKVILDEFPDTSLEDVTKIVKRYRNIDSWFDTTYIEKENFEHIQEIMKNAGELEKYAPYEKLVTTKFAKK